MGFLKNALRWIGGGVLLAILIGVGLYVSGVGSFGSEEGSSVESEREDLELVSHKGEMGEEGPVSVTGVVRNSSGREHRNVQVEISLYDEAGTQVGSTRAEINTLEPGGEWRFEAPVTQDDVARYEVERVTWR